MKKVISIAMLCAAGSANAVVTDITSSNQFKNSTESGNAIVKFSAEWCGPCKTSAKPFENLSNDEEFKGISFLHVDVDHNKELADEFGIQGIPTFVYIDHGKEVNRHSGNLNANDAKLNLRKAFAHQAPQMEQTKQPQAETKQAMELKPEAPVEVSASWWSQLITTLQEQLSKIKNSIMSLFSRN